MTICRTQRWWGGRRASGWTGRVGRQQNSGRRCVYIIGLLRHKEHSCVSQSWPMLMASTRPRCQHAEQCEVQCWMRAQRHTPGWRETCIGLEPLSQYMEPHLTVIAWQDTLGHAHHHCAMTPHWTPSLYCAVLCCAALLASGLLALGFLSNSSTRLLTWMASQPWPQHYCKQPHKPQ